MRWEYEIFKYPTEGAFTVKVDDDSLNLALNRLGRDGWEVVSSSDVTHGGWTKYLVFTLKRPVNEGSGADPRHPLDDLQP